MVQKSSLNTKKKKSHLIIVVGILVIIGAFALVIQNTGVDIFEINGTTGAVIQQALVSYGQNGYNYQSNNTNYNFYVKTNSNYGDGTKFCSNETGIEYCLTYQSQDMSYRNQYGSQDYLSSISGVVGNVSENSILYENVFPNTSLQYEANEYQLSQLYILTSKPRDPYSWLGDSNNVTLDYGGYVKYGNLEVWANGQKQTGDFVTSEEIEFKKNGATLFSLPKPFAYDSNFTSTELEYEVKNQGNQIWFYTRTPYSWLNDSSRVYPVYIDPSVTSGTQDQITSIGNFIYVNTSDIVLYYPFDNDNSTTAFDLSPNHNDGNILNGVTLNSGGVYGNYTDFPDVNNNRIQTQGAVTQNTSYAISTWVWFDDYSSDYMWTQAVWIANERYPSSSGNEWQLSAYHSQNITFQFTATNGTGYNFVVYDNTSSGIIGLNQWHHMLISVDNINKEVNTYLDGVSITNGTFPSGATPRTNVADYVRLGMPGWFDNAYELHGQLDDFIYFNKSLTNGEAIGVYNNQTARHFSYGDTNFTGNNFGTNNTLNITLDDCQTIVNSYIQASVNGGSFENLTGCSLTGYSMPGDTTDATVDLRLVSGNGGFYTPYALGNVTFDSYSSGSDNYPTFTTFLEDQSNNSAYSNGYNYAFNSTVSNTNGTVGLSFNGVNYSASNVGSVYGVYVGDLAAGTYDYYWWGYGDGASEYFNKSSTRTYWVATATPSGSISGTTPITSGTAADVTGSETNSGDGDLAYTLYREGTLVSNPDTSTLGEGTYNYVYNTSGGTNYSSSASLDTFQLVVNPAADTTYPLFSGYVENPSNNSVYSYGQSYQINASVTFTNGTVGLSFNGANFSASNVSSEFFATVGDLAAGTYDYYWWGYGNGTNNNFNSSSARSYVIAKDTPSGDITGTTPIYNDTAADITGSETNSGDGDLSYTLYREGTLVSNPDTTILSTPGTYNYVYNTSGGTNYSSSASLDTFSLRVYEVGVAFESPRYFFGSGRFILSGNSRWRVLASG